MELLSFGVDVIEAAAVQECLFGEVIEFAADEFFERVHGVFDGDVSAGVAGELFGNEVGLRHEPLDLSGAGYDQLVVVAEFIDPENCDDVLQFSVALQNLLNFSGHFVVSFADDAGVEVLGRGREGVNRRVETLGGDGSLQVNVGVQVAKCGCRSRVGWVVGRNVDRLN